MFSQNKEKYEEFDFKIRVVCFAKISTCLKFFICSKEGKSEGFIKRQRPRKIDLQANAV